MLRDAAKKVLEKNAYGGFINEFICVYLNRAYGHKEYETVEQLKKRIYAYIHPYYTYWDYTQNYGDVYAKRATPWIQFMRSKFCEFLAEEYEAKGE